MKNENIINTYGYIVVENKNHIPLHIVEMYCELFVGVKVFNNANNANKYIKKEMEENPTIIYNPNFVFTKGIVDAYKNTDNIFSNINSKQVFCR